MTIEPETKNWTWVLEHECEECGFDVRSFPQAETASRFRLAGEPWPAFLADPRAGDRPDPACWSALEYGCHVRDVFRRGVQRAGRMLHEEDPVFENWDQDASAIADRYDRQDPVEVGDQIVVASGELAALYESVRGDQWARTGTRSDGAPFTVESFGRYLLHDLMHHLVDVRRGFDALRARPDAR